MSITDELMEWTRTHTVNCSDNRIALVAIADRIDDAHERELRETGEDIVRDVRREWVRLPLDADGVPIRVGDVLDGYGKTIEVVEMRHGRSGWVFISRDGNGYVDTFAFTHHHTPTVEDVLYDSLRHFGAVEERTPEVEEWLHEQAAKLRLAGDE